MLFLATYSLKSDDSGITQIRTATVYIDQPGFFNFPNITPDQSNKIFDTINNLIIEHYKTKKYVIKLLSVIKENNSQIIKIEG